MEREAASGRPDQPEGGPGGGNHGRGVAQASTYRGLYCTLPTFAGAAPANPEPSARPPAEERDVVRRGYLRGSEQPVRTYFVLREGSHTGPGRLESYASEEVFAAARASASHTLPLGSSSRRVIVYLCHCLGVTKNDNCLNGHTVTLYARGQTVVLVAEDQDDQCKWYLDIKRLVEEERRGGQREPGDGGETPSGQQGESFDREDDGYCTLASDTFFKEVWSTSVKPCGLGLSMCMAGDACLCLSASSIVLLAADTAAAGGDAPSVTLPLRSVRNFGHNGGLFFLEVGGLAPFGPGKIWLEARERGDPVQAQHMYEAIREAMRALRLLPDFSCSPTSSSLLQGPQGQPRGQPGPPGPRWTPDKSSYMTMSPPARGQTGRPSCASSPCRQPAGFSLCSRPGQPYGQPGAGEGAGYMVMSPGKLREFGAGKEGSCTAQASTSQPATVGASEGRRSPGGREEYVMMRPLDGPRLSQSSSEDAYVPMKSPLAQHASPMMLFSNAASRSPLHQSDCHAAESSQSSSLAQREPAFGQEDQEEVAGLQPANGSSSRHIIPVQATPTSGPKEAVVRKSGVTTPVQSDPVESGPERSTGRRYRLSACLPSCLQARER